MYFRPNAIQRLAVLILLAVALPVSGCHRRHVITKDELAKLDGFNPERPVIVLGVDGKEVEYTGHCKLAFLTEEGETERQKFVQIRIDGNRFEGITREGERVRVDLREVHHAAVYVPDALRVVEIIGAAVVGTLAVAAVVLATLVVILIVYAIWWLLTDQDNVHDHP